MMFAEEFAPARAEWERLCETLRWINLAARRYGLLLRHPRRELRLIVVLAQGIARHRATFAAVDEWHHTEDEWQRACRTADRLKRRRVRIYRILYGYRPFNARRTAERLGLWL